MRAAITSAHGDREVLQLVDDYPAPVARAGEVVVDIAATALNFHDIFTRRGMPGIRINLPIVLGSDIAGRVASLGDGVTGWAVGDRVLIDPVFRGARPGMIGETVDGGRAEQVKCFADQLVRVPDAVSVEDAATLPLAYGTAYRMMLARGRVKAGETVLILGAGGGVGTACVQLAKMRGATVIACASSQAKLARLEAIGADHLIDYSKTDLADGVQAIVGKPRVSGEGGVDVAVNFTGGDNWIPTQRCVKRGGRMLTCGATAGFTVAMDLRYLWTFEHDVIGSNGWAKEDLAQLMDLIAQGRLKPLVDRILPLDEAAEAERLLEEREVVGKVLLKP